MLLNYINGHPLAMLPEKVDEIMTFLQSRQDGIKLEIDEKYEKEENINVSDGIATVNIFGSISRRMNLMQKMSGGVSVELLEKQLNELNQDDSIKGVLLNIDSPGGSVHGIKSVADVIHASTKPFIAYSDGLIASAAYWIASACDLVIVSDTATVGSIGVVTVHTDQSKADENKGVKNTVLTAGKYKAISNPHEELTDEGRLEIQDKLDQYYSLFVENVAANRGIETEKILDVADGKTYIGKNAPEELINLKGSMNLAYNELNNLIKEEMKDMTLEEFKASEHYATIKAEFEAKADLRVKDAINAERSRCADILAIEGGHEDIKLSAIREGKSVDSIYADLYKAEISAKTDEIERIKAVTEPVSVSSAKPELPAKKGFMQVVHEKQAGGAKFSEAMFAAMKEHPELHAEYVQNCN